MICPQTITEQIMYNSVRIVTKNGRGTGFFFQYSNGTSTVPILITNKHVVNFNAIEKAKILVHTGDISKNYVDENSVEVELKLKWIFHSKHDLCFCFIAPIIQKVNQVYGKQMFYIAIDENMIPDQKGLEELSAVEEVLMVGYPIGLWDKKHNLPLFRNSIEDKLIGELRVLC